MADRMTDPAAIDYESDDYWSRGYAEYDGTDCTKCGRQRVEKYANGRRVCEKCMWDQEAGDYAYDHHEMNN